MRIQLGVPEELDDKERKEALDAALEATTVANEAMVRRGLVPPAARAIKAGKVKWEPEPAGQDEHFDLGNVVLARGHGDCDDLAPWHAGSLRASGTDPDAHAFVKRSGPNRWHALVRRGDGSIEDPSIAAGMLKHRSHNVSGVGGGTDAIVGAIVKPMSADAQMCLAICPHKTDPKRPVIWYARLDVPSVTEPWAWTSTAAAHDGTKALTNAIKGARVVGEADIDEEHEARLAVIHDLINGADPHEVSCALEEMAGPNVDPMRVMIDGVNVGNFFKSISRGLKHLAKPFASIASKALQFVPGVGPIASTALDMAAKMLPADHPAHPANAGKPGHADAVHALMASGHPAYAAAAQPTGYPQGEQQSYSPWLPGTFGGGSMWSAPAWGFQPGQPWQPWGPSSPSVMRF
jgi:hypothetical protein